jgi:hypothetical protein
MKIITEKYLTQLKRWPESGRHILAQYDEEKIVVYQAYRPSIGLFASQNKYFGGEFSLDRMSWIKTNFLWMMYRCGWATKNDQEIVLAVSLKLEGFNEILSLVEYSSFDSTIYKDEQEWKTKLKHSPVRLQWDPDHSPTGNKLDRKAIQLGLSGDVLRRYAKEWVVDIEDITDFVSQQRTNATPSLYENLITPKEGVYKVSNELLARKLKLSTFL